MNRINSYKDLLKEEERIAKELELSTDIIQANINSYLAPKNLYRFFESKLEEKLNKEFSDEFELKKYLIGLSMDFLYEKMTESLLTSSAEKTRGIDWRIIARSLVDRLYINNKPMITDAISDFIDKGLAKFKG